MITVDTFVTDTLNTVDAVIGTFVQSAYMHLIQGNSEVITLLFTLYIILIGYQFIYHGHHFTMSTIIKKIIILLIVYALIMNWNLYDLFIYKIFTIEPNNIANVLVSNDGSIQAGNSIAQALDQIYKAVVTASANFFSQSTFSFSGVAFLFYGALVFFIGTLMTVFALLLFIYAKMVMAVSLALGPIFILFLLWDTTKALFSSWLNKLITIALIPIITSAILMLMINVINVTLPQINTPAENLQFYGIAPFLGLAIATSMILSQVFRISSALGGGFTLASISAGASIVQSTFQKTGISRAARSGAKWGQAQVRNMRNKKNRGNT